MARHSAPGRQLSSLSNEEPVCVAWRSIQEVVEVLTGWSPSDFKNLERRSRGSFRVKVEAGRWQRRALEHHPFEVSHQYAKSARLTCCDFAWTRSGPSFGERLRWRCTSAV